MSAKKKAPGAGKNLASSNGAKAGNGGAASERAQRDSSSSYRVTATSGKVISRTVTTHRDALKRLADR